AKSTVGRSWAKAGPDLLAWPDRACPATTRRGPCRFHPRTRPAGTARHGAAGRRNTRCRWLSRAGAAHDRSFSAGQGQPDASRLRHADVARMGTRTAALLADRNEQAAGGFGTAG